MLTDSLNELMFIMVGCLASGRQKWSRSCFNNSHGEKIEIHLFNKGMNFWNLKADLHWHISSTRPRLIIFPKHFYQLGINNSNKSIYEGHSQSNHKQLYSAHTLLYHFWKRLNYSFTEITNDEVVPYTNKPDYTLLF